MCIVLGDYTQFFQDFSGFCKRGCRKYSNISVQIIFPDYPLQLWIIFLQPLSTNSENKDGKRGTKIISPIILTNISILYFIIILQPLPQKATEYILISAQPSRLTETYPPIASPAMNLWYLPGYFVP